MARTSGNTLRFTDLIVLAIIFFGLACATAIEQYFQLRQQGLSEPVELVFSEADNYGSIVLELALLAAAGIYLKFRRFDFGLLNFSANRYTLPLALLLIACAGIAAELYQSLWCIFSHVPDPSGIMAENSPEGSRSFGHISPSLIIFSLLNGFYEELFFLGLIFAVTPKVFPWSAALGFGVRFLFHIYQGLHAAAMITVMGVLFFLLRRKISTLLPFMLAHAFFDVFGLGLLQWLYR